MYDDYNAALLTKIYNLIPVHYLVDRYRRDKGGRRGPANALN